MYTPEEMGAPVVVSESGDVVIDAEATEIENEETATGIEEMGTKAKMMTANGKQKKGPRPWRPEILRLVMKHNVEFKADWTNEPNQKQIGLLASKLEEALGANQDAQVNRYTFTEWMTGERSLTKVGIAWVATLLDWLLDEKDESTGDYPFKAHAVTEANQVLRQAMLDQGQQEMPLDEAAKTPEQHKEELFGNGGNDA